MRLTTIHKKKIIEVLKANLERGINSKYLIYHITPRYSARLHELRKEGYVFRKKVEKIGGSRFDRFWLVSEPGHTIKKKTYTFDPVRQVYIIE